MMASKSEVLDDLPIDIMVLDVEFTGYLRIARDYMKQMRLADDRRVCEKYIRSCMKMSGSDHYNVKMHRNRFFRYLLKTMKKTVETQALHFVHMPEGVAFGEAQEMTQWSADKKSYVSAKVIPGFGTLIYMACASQPELGWDENGFAQFHDVSDVPNFMSLSEEDRDAPASLPRGKSVTIIDPNSNLDQPDGSSSNPVPATRST